MNIDKFIQEVELIINNNLYEKKLITYSEYIKVIDEVKKKKKCF